MPEISGPQSSRLRVLVCDETPAIARLAAKALRQDGYECEVCQTSDDILSALETRGADIVLADVETQAAKILPRLRAEYPEVALILLSSSPAAASAVAALRRGAFDYLIKPFEEESLSAAVGRAAEILRLRSENSALRRHLEAAAALASFVAESQSARALVALVRRAARADSSVLIEGEPGVGKQLVARIIHDFSSRTNRPLVVLNCKGAGLAEQGPDGGRRPEASGCRGAFARASGGSILLSEISEASPALQAQITALLEEREAAGGNVRLLASSGRPLAALVDSGAFRGDLFFRINVISVRVPPLRERREDIVPLAHQFLDEYAVRVGRPLALTSEAERALLAHAWPGNVRELRNAIERAVALTTADFLTSKSFGLTTRPEVAQVREAAASANQRAEAAQAAELPPTEPVRPARPRREPAPVPEAGSAAKEAAGAGDGDGGANEATLSENKSSGTLQEVLDHAAQARIKTALDAAGGNRTAAASALDIDAGTLARLIRRLGL